MIELRWVLVGSHRLLEYRVWESRMNTSTAINPESEWSSWKGVPEVDAVAAGYEADRQCSGCRYWSAMLLRVSSGAREAVCLSLAGPLCGTWVRGHQTCMVWAPATDGAIDEPGKDHARYNSGWAAPMNQCELNQLDALNLLRAIVERDHDFFGADADTSNPDSLYSLIHRGRELIRISEEGVL